MYTSLGKTKPFDVPDRSWTTVPSYDKEYTNNGTYTGDDAIRIKESGVYIFFAHIKCPSNGEGQRTVRFMRDLGTNNDHTGAMDRNSTPGNDFICHSWPSYMAAGQRMSLQFWQSSGEVIRPTLVQFKAVKVG